MTDFFREVSTSSVYLVTLDALGDLPNVFAVTAEVPVSGSDPTIKEIAVADGTLLPFASISNERFQEIVDAVLEQEWRRRTPKHIRAKP